MFITRAQLFSMLSANALNYYEKITTLRIQPSSHLDWMDLAVVIRIRKQETCI